MVRVANKLKVLQRIVGSILVPVVNGLAAVKLSPQVLLHDDPVLKQVLLVAPDVHVAVSEDEASASPVGVGLHLRDATNVLVEGDTSQRMTKRFVLCGGHLVRLLQVRVGDHRIELALAKLASDWVLVHTSYHSTVRTGMEGAA